MVSWALEGMDWCLKIQAITRLKSGRIDQINVRKFPRAEVCGHTFSNGIS
jgi:hypothetical protein